jgi:hypothetical protein
MPEKEAIVYLSRTFAEEHDLDVSAITVHFGAWKREVKLSIDPDLPPDQIGLADGMMKKLTVPSHLPYDVRIDKNGLHIGPVIGFIASQSREWITPEKLNHHIQRLSDYENIRGLIFLCSVDDIDLKTRTIRGYYYDPAGPDGPQWVEGRFPYPGAFYKRVRIDQQVYDDLTKVISPDRVFNRNFFYKLRFWNIMSRIPDVREHLPYTEELADIRQLDRFLGEYRSVFLKPSRGLHGRGIVHVKKKRDRYLVSFREGMTASILTKRQVVDLLNQLKDRKTYLIQQAVQMKYGKSPVDFRVYMQKDSRQQWTCKGMVARIAKAGSIVTNLGYLDRLMYPDEAIQKVYQLNHDEAKSLERHIREVCCNVCNTLDRLSVGLYGDVAIDLTVDRNRKVWILEINKKYGCKFLELLGDTHLLREILTGPLKYARALAGFPDGEEFSEDRSTSVIAVSGQDSRMLDQILVSESDNSAEAPAIADKGKDDLSVEPSANLENPSDLASEKKQPVSVDPQKGDPPNTKPRPVAARSGNSLSNRPRSEESRAVYPLRHLRRSGSNVRGVDVRAAMRLHRKDYKNNQKMPSYHQPDKPRPLGSGGPLSGQPRRSEKTENVNSRSTLRHNPNPAPPLIIHESVWALGGRSGY